jgi:hypothetical protein
MHAGNSSGGLPFGTRLSTNGAGAIAPAGVSVARFGAQPPGGEGSGPIRAGSPGGRPADSDRELLAKRDRLIERFAAMQLDLGGVYYEMAIRDHISSDVLIRKAAEMQRVDAELRQVEAMLHADGSRVGRCPACESPYASGAVFCSQCGTSLAAGDQFSGS